MININIEYLLIVLFNQNGYFGLEDFWKPFID